MRSKLPLTEVLSPGRAEGRRFTSIPPEPLNRRIEGAELEPPLSGAQNESEGWATYPALGTAFRARDWFRPADGRIQRLR